MPRDRPKLAPPVLGPVHAPVGEIAKDQGALHLQGDEGRAGGGAASGEIQPRHPERGADRDGEGEAQGEPGVVAQVAAAAIRVGERGRGGGLGVGRGGHHRRLALGLGQLGAGEDVVGQIIGQGRDGEILEPGGGKYGRKRAREERHPSGDAAARPQRRHRGSQGGAQAGREQARKRELEAELGGGEGELLRGAAAAGVLFGRRGHSSRTNDGRAHRTLHTQTHHKHALQLRRFCPGLLITAAVGMIGSTVAFSA